MRNGRRGNAWDSVGCVGTHAVSAVQMVEMDGCHPEDFEKWSRTHTHSFSQMTILHYRSFSDLSPECSATETSADPLSVFHSVPGSIRPLLAETPSSQAQTFSTMDRAKLAFPTLLSLLVFYSQAMKIRFYLLCLPQPITLLVS